MMSLIPFYVDIMEEEETAFKLIPPEIIEHIFLFLDGCTFCVARQVCKAWNDIFKRMQVKKRLWKDICLREIPKNVLEEILCFKSIPITDLDWMSFYKKWFCSRMITKSLHWKKIIYAHHCNPITCLKISGSYVITGHSNGIICIWNLYSGELHQNLMCHLKTITDIALVDLLNLESYYGSEEMPWSHHHLITISKDRYIHFVPLLEPMVFNYSDLHINHHTDDLKQVKVFGDMFAVSCRDNTVSLWKMQVLKRPYFHLKVSMIRHVVGPIDFLLSMGFWHDEIQCITHGGKLKTLDISEDGGEWMEKSYLKNSYVEEGDNITSVTAAFVFRNRTVILLTTDGKMVVSINKNCSKRYHLMQTLRTVLVSVAFYGSILALGGENGKLFLFYVSSETALTELNLSQPDLTLYLSEASVIAIDISYQTDSPIITASTTESIFIFKWYKQSSSHQVLKSRTRPRLMF